MNISKLYYFGLILGGGLVFTSCIDDKYDLNDVDTTTRIKVEGLVLPINLETVTLDQVFDLDDEDPDNLLKVVKDASGKEYYAIEVEGSFEAKPVDIPVFEAITETGFTVDPLEIPVVNSKIQPSVVDFSYLIKDVDPALKSLSYFQIQKANLLELNVKITPATVTMTDVILQLPTGYTATYKNKTYTGTVPVTVSNGKLDQGVYITEMAFKPSKIVTNSELDLDGEIGFQSATVMGADKIIAQFTMSDFKADVVSGNFYKEVDSPEIAPIDLNNLPDFLKDGESDLILQNPQLYMYFGALYGAYYNMDLEIKPQGINTRNIDITLDPFQTSIVVAPDVNHLGLPNPPDKKQEEDELMYILSGTGLPTTIDFSIPVTYLNGDVTKLPLGVPHQIKGDYTFFSPLAFAPGSQIIYTKVEDDFFGEDSEKILVDNLQLTANVSTNLPFAVTLTVYPLDRYGNRLASASSKISKMASKEKLDLNFSKFQGLDGIEFIVTADNMDGTTLTPSEYIDLTEIRAKVTGEYVAVDSKYEDKYPEYK